MRLTLIKTRGFTIVELLIALTVAGIILPILFGPIDDLYQSFVQSTKYISQTADVHNAVRTLQNEVAYATTFNTTIAATSPQGMNNDGTAWDWKGSDSDHRVLILSVYATTAAKSENTRLLAFGTDCTTPLTNTYIYFVKDSNLYRRTIKSTSANCPSTPIIQKNSCAGGCSASDALIAANVSKFSVDYYLNSTSAASMTGQYDAGSTAPSSAQTVVITVTTTTGQGSNQASATRTLRVTRINGVTA